MSVFMPNKTKGQERQGRLRKRADTASYATATSITITDPSVSAPTELPEILIFVDKHGVAHSTVTEIVAVVPQSSANGTASKTGSPSGTAAVRAPIHLDADGNQVSAPTQTAVAPQAADAGGSGLPGVTYSPYNSDGTCKSAGQVLSDFQQLSGMYGLIRVYGTDCDQVNSVMAAAGSINVQMMLGIFNLDDLDTQVSQLVQGVNNNGGWARVAAVSVGNELVNNGQATPAQVVGAVTSARQSLRAAGYQGPVVTVDTFVAVQKNPSLCDNSDFCAMNIHPFFDANTDASSAGDFVTRQVANTRQVLANPNQRIVVTESGWPWQGSANGAAVPGKDNQATAVDSIRSTYGSLNPSDLILFTAFNDLWKTAAPGTFYAEQYWGMVSGLA